MAGRRTVSGLGIGRRRKSRIDAAIEDIVRPKKVKKKGQKTRK